MIAYTKKILLTSVLLLTAGVNVFAAQVGEIVPPQKEYKVSCPDMKSHLKFTIGKILGGFLIRSSELVEGTQVIINPKKGDKPVAITRGEVTSFGDLYCYGQFTVDGATYNLRMFHNETNKTCKYTGNGTFTCKK